MHLRVVSDTHLEQFVHTTVLVGTKWDEYVAPPQDQDAESILVLAGDICEFGYITFYAAAWKALANRFKAVVWIPGNHEYCGATTPYGNQTFFYFKELLRKYGKIHLLDDSSITIDGTKIYGTSLWTDYRNNPLYALQCSGMWDFRHGLTYENEDARRTTPSDYVTRHKVAIDKLQTELAKPGELVVVSHFAPSKKSTHARYAAQPDGVNSHFVNDLDQLIEANPQIRLWIHGHTHTQFDYMVGSTRVVCNPKGFPTEDTSPIGDLTFIEVPKIADQSTSTD